MAASLSGRVTGSGHTPPSVAPGPVTATAGSSARAASEGCEGHCSCPPRHGGASAPYGKT
eukprot:7604816-Alexandrium_andersonii.AAC.1